MSGALLASVQFPHHDYSWLAQFFSLWVLPFAHEDLAIILGGYIVVNKTMPVGLVAASIYGGMVASDFALYVIGAGARRVPWLTRFAVDDRVGSFAEVLKRNLFGLVALCRVVPGAVFVAFIACGWSRVPLGRFTVASLVVSALYLPLMLYLVIVSGDALDDRVGFWAWPVLLTLTVALGFVRWRIFTFQRAASQVADRAALARAPGGSVIAPNGLVRRFAERIPSALLCLPLIASWLRLAWRHRSLTLPTAVNPRLSAAGGWDESRSAALLDVPASERRWTAEFVVVRRSSAPRTLYADLERVRQMLCDAQLTFPLVAKPDIGWRGLGVRRIDDVSVLREYLRDFPGGARLLLQRFVPYAAAAAVFYARLPGAERGRILSLTLRHAAGAAGDGDTGLREHTGKFPCACGTLEREPGQIPADGELDGIPARGEPVQPAPILPMGRCSRDANRHITPELEARFDTIAKGMSEFHYGRFDLRFSSLDQLMRGEDFCIVGVGGIGVEPVDTWDPHLPLSEVYRRQVDRQRILFLIGEKNRIRGFAPMRCTDVIRRLVRRAQLARRYPASA